MVFAGVAVALLAVPFAQIALAQSTGKTAICHFPADKTTGIILEVSDEAVAVHVKLHGDSKKFTRDKRNPNKCFAITKCKPKKCPIGYKYNCKTRRCERVDDGCKHKPCPKGYEWNCKAEKCQKAN